MSKIATVSVGTGQGMSIFPKCHKDAKRSYLTAVTNNMYLNIYLINVTDVDNA